MLLDAACCSPAPIITASSAASYTAVNALHLHVDGGEHIDMVTALLDDLKSLGMSGKLHTITEIIAGSQRQELPSTYSSHTPGTSDCEQFEFFSTIGLADRDMALSTLKHILPRLEGNPGIVVEVEHVVANIDRLGIWQGIDLKSVEEIPSESVGLRRLPKLPFEIHHCIDIYDAGPNPLNIRDLMTDTKRLGISLGGWFAFEKEGRASYRSNAFTNAPNLKQNVFTQYELLSTYLVSTGMNVTLRTIVEHVLGVWKIA